MTFLSRKLGFPSGISAFEVGVGLVAVIAAFQMAMLVLYLLILPVEGYTTAGSSGSGSVGITYLSHESSHYQDQDDDSGTGSEQSTASEVDGDKDQDGQLGTTDKDESTDSLASGDPSGSKDAGSKEDSGSTELPDATLAKGTLTRDLVGPLRSQIRAVRAMRFGVFISSILLCMLTVVVLLKVNRLSHAKYAGRMWWIGLVVIPGWLLAGMMIAWNNDLWDSIFDAKDSFGILSFW